MVSVEELKSLKEKLIEERAVSQSDAKNTQQAIEKFKAGMATLGEEHFNALTAIGVNTDFIKNIDTEKMAKDQKYVDSLTIAFDEMCDKIYQEILGRISD